MRQTIAITLTVLLVGIGVPTVAHDAEYEVHTCFGDTAWDISRFGAQLNGLYVHLYLTNDGEEDSPGILWMESNGWTKESTKDSKDPVASDLQKDNFVCRSLGHGDPKTNISHPDTVIL